MTLGQSFDGYTLVSFDPRQEVLTVRRRDYVLELPLKGAHVRAIAGSPVAEELAVAGITPDDLAIRDGGPVRITHVTPPSLISITASPATLRR